MRAAIQTILLGALVAAAGPAFAQQAALQDRMSAAQFRAAGLDTLDAAQLAELARWFERELASDERLADARREGQQSAAPSPEPEAAPVDSTIVGGFDGFAKGREYTLANGQVWKQLDTAQLPGVRLQDAPVQIRQSRMGGTWWLRVDNRNTRARVERIR